MQTMRLYTLGESTIDFDPSVPCIVVKQIGFLTSDEFREIQEKGLDLYAVKKKEYGKLAWLSNIQESDAVEMESLKWAVEELTPRCYQAGNRYSAVVLPEEEYSMASMNAETFEENMDQKEPLLNIRRFKDEELAKAWLREVLHG